METKKTNYSIYLTVLLGLFFCGVVNAAPCKSHNVSGSAWSSNIGWISMNCNDTGSGIDYGVDIDEDTGDFSGSAWSSNIGWVDFNNVLVNKSTGDVSGWAQVESVVGQPLEISGGWDGKISLSGTISGYSDYQITVNDSLSPYEFEGYAWGGEVVGWISFNCSNDSSCGASDYKVTTNISFNAKPVVDNLSISDITSCGSSSPGIIFNWNFNDSGDTQSAYQINYLSLPMPPAVNFDSGKIISKSDSYVPLGLSFDRDYVWTVRVWDSSDLSSSFAIPQPLTTSARFPSPSFTLNPATDILAEQEVNFINNTTNCASCSYSWNFGDGTTSSETNPTHVFDNPGSYSVELTAASAVGSCVDSKTVIIGNALPLPTWQEVKPF